VEAATDQFNEYRGYLGDFYPKMILDKLIFWPWEKLGLVVDYFH